MLGVVLVPGLLAAGVGLADLRRPRLLDRLRHVLAGGPEHPAVRHAPTVAEFLWAIAIGVAAAVLGAAIRRLGLLLQPFVERRSRSR